MHGRKEKTLYVNIIIFLIGVVFVLTAIILRNIETIYNIFFSIGLTFISSTLVLFINRLFETPKEVLEIYETWKIDAIYETRSKMNGFAGEHLLKVKYNFDIVGFGLKTLRESKGSVLEQKLLTGVNIRILTMNPKSLYLKQREKDENKQKGEISETIRALGQWVSELKAKYPNVSDRITIKYYDAIPLDHFCRQDGVIFVGGHQYGKESQQSITYQFSKSGLGYDYYLSYFESLWNNDNFCSMTYV